MGEINYRIKISNKSICQRTLAWLRDHSEINRNGIIQVEKSINGMGANQIIMGEIDFEPVILEGTKIRLIRQALTRWRQSEDYYNSDDLVKTFNDTLEAELIDLEKQKSSFTILAFFNIEQDAITSLFPQTIHESILQFPTWSGLEHLNTDKFWQEVEFYLSPSNRSPLLKKIVTRNQIHYLKQTQDFVPITIELQAINADTALYMAVDALDLFRGLINLPSALRLFRRYGSGSSSLSTFLPSPIYGIFRDSGEFETIYYSDVSYNYNRQTISETDLAYCTDLLNVLKNALPGDLQYLLVKAVKLYQQAFDFTDYRATYLGLWQLLEVLTLNEPSQGRTQVDKRIANLLGLSGDEVIRDALKVLMESRNTLVHSGVFPEYADGLVFLLKGIVDEMLMKIMGLSAHLSTETELQEYYRLASKNNIDLTREVTDIEVTKKVINFIQNLRAKN